MQKVSTAKKTEQVLNEELESSIKEALKEAHFKGAGAGARFAAEPTAKRMRQIGVDEVKDRLARDRAVDFNLIGHEQEAREACLRDAKKALVAEQFELRGNEDESEINSLASDEWMKDYIKAYKILVKTDFHSWYTGNYNKETGRITLYRYMDNYPGFDKVMRGEEELVPKGLVGRSDEELLGILKKTRDRYLREIHGVYSDYLQGKDVSLRVYRLPPDSYPIDPTMCWTNSGTAPPGELEEMRYRIKIEVKPNEAFRFGGLDEKGDWAGIFTFLEWRTIGKVPKEAITEILDLQSGKVVYSKKK
jgi:hypothetical protein